MVTWVGSRKSLEIVLEHVKAFKKPKEHLEQYITPSRIAADVLWRAYMAGDIAGKTLIDMGCGTGKLSYGGLLLGASSVICLDIDFDALRDAETVLCRAEGPGIAYSVACDCSRSTPLRQLKECVVIMNPPFGIKCRGVDLEFLIKAVELCRTVYSIHKLSHGLLKAIESRFRKSGLPVEVQVLKTFKFPIRWFLPKHRRKVYYVDAVLLKVVKKHDCEKQLSTTRP